MTPRQLVLMEHPEARCRVVVQFGGGRGGECREFGVLSTADRTHSAYSSGVGSAA